MESIDFSNANCTAKSEILLLLEESDLPLEDIGEHLGNFLLAETNNSLVGVVGLEIYNDIGLLRSLAVARSFQGKGLGKELCTRMQIQARALGIKRLVLLTTTAETFFLLGGFQKLERESVSEAIKNTREFQELSPESAVCMEKVLI